MIKDPPIVVLTGVLCVFFWMVAYVAIIYRGFRDKTYGMPLAALGANLSWEAIYSFFLDPMGDHIHALSIPCFFMDLVIAWQVFKYGSRDRTATPFARRYFKALFCAAVVIAFPLVYLAFYEFHDPLGEYTGFGINFMMSFLFVAMLTRREGVAGQSLYVAVSKWLGTLFAYLATGLTVTTSKSHPMPDSLWSFVTGTVTSTSYPLTPLISVLYLVVFLVDVLYIALLYARLKEAGISPWRRF
ncbi:hypothetical protein [Streptomyces noursei]|uniref:transmembrane-type terpene cyclase n=1 Tax=Streptomyces noursei TaxID=1971 RepID=UPI0023B78188|nr:hypothetical protein [Streptomyces noursei]